MTVNELFVTLAIAAATVGSLHSAAPDHWVPFAMLGRARGWSAARTARMTILCGLGHLTVSAFLGLVGLSLGLRVVETLGAKLESFAAIALIAFGTLYAVWGLRKAAGQRLHGHAHWHYDHIHDLGSTSEWTLFLLFSADPCVAVLPLIFASASLPGAATAGIIVIYEVATIATMVGLVLPARAGASLLRGDLLNRYGHVTAGALIALTGLLVTVLGI